MTFHQVGFASSPRKGKLHRPGDFLDQSLRCVCAECNNGWMSELQEEARPIIEPLILGGPAGLPDQRSRFILSRWVAMLCAVSEFTDIATVCLSQLDRLEVMNGVALTHLNYVGIARYAGSLGNQCYHRAMSGIVSSPHSSLMNPLRTYVTFLVLGEVTILVCGGSEQIFSKSVVEGRWWDAKFLGVWPLVETRYNPAPVNDLDLFDIINALGGAPILPYSKP